jgi:formamidopyrimidine-DNA glycosylase
MPELPEVEHTARMLRRWLDGKRIVRAEAPPTRIFRGSDAGAFERELRGRRLQRIDRRGKYLLFTFDGGVGLLAHLGMTGKWVRRDAGSPPPRHVRAALHLEDGSAVLYDDPRLFGRIALVPAEELFACKEIVGLGADPLVEGVDAARLGERLRRSSRAVKIVLMDQAAIAGIGNIQATEALFEARIHPSRPANTLDDAEIAALATAIEETIARTLRQIGDEEIVYVEEPGAENPFLIYGRAGQPCPRCGATLEKLVLGGRTSVYCPHCQRL